MGKLELDKWDLKRLWELWKKGRINLQPEYQRGNVWDNPRKYDLIDTIIRKWPSGLVMLRAYEQEDITEGLEKFDVVDGQQRLTTLFEYIDGSQVWALKAPPKLRESFTPYKELSDVKQSQIDEYKVAVAFMRDFDVTEILDVYSRLQTGKPLKIGEKVKALRTPFKEYLKDLASHKLFDFDQHRFRDSNWNLAAQFLKATYTHDPLARVEFPELKAFLEGEFNEAQAKKAKDYASRAMSFEKKVFDEAVIKHAAFEEYLSSARTLKWVFAVLLPLLHSYSFTGREHLVADGIIEYYSAKAREGSKEWECYLNSGRTGRMDTDDVKVCLSQMTGYIINASDAVPVDSKRYFTPDQREKIWESSDKNCAQCLIKLTRTNFHADHVKPHSEGGSTSVENGQVLCARCNLVKGKDIQFKYTD